MTSHWHKSRARRNLVKKLLEAGAMTFDEIEQAIKPLEEGTTPTCTLKSTIAQLIQKKEIFFQRVHGSPSIYSLEPLPDVVATKDYKAIKNQRPGHRIVSIDDKCNVEIMKSQQLRSHKFGIGSGLNTIFF